MLIETAEKTKEFSLIHIDAQAEVDLARAGADYLITSDSDLPRDSSGVSEKD